MLKNLIIDISELNPDDDLDFFRERTEYRITEGLSNYAEEAQYAFIITDSREIADKGKRKGIGFALYTNGKSNSESFKDALYCIERLSDTSDEALERMYLRYKGLPWDILESSRCLVREITVEDIDALYEIYDDKETKRYIEDLYAEKAKEVIFTREYIANQYRFFEYGIWVVIDKSNGRIIGRAGLSERAGFDNLELGFIFRKEYWGKGFAYEVCSGIIDYAKDYLGIDRIISFTMNENIRAIRLLERLGFSYDGMTSIDLGSFRKYSRKI